MRRSMLRSATMAVAVLLNLGVPVRGQQPDGPYWVTTPIPAGFQSVTNIGTSATIRATGTVTFFSSILRTFTTVPVSPTAQIYSFNDYCVVKEATTVTAYCTRTGIASSITVSASATLYNGPTSSSWASVVIDGTTAYGYGAFVGVWSSTTIGSGTTLVSAGNQCMLVWDGVDVHAITSLAIGWTSFTPSGPLLGQASSGFVGLAWTSSEVYGFSVHHQQWTTLAYGVGGVPTLRDNFAVFNVGATSALFYSAITQTFATYAGANPPFALTSAQNVATITDGAVVQLYSPTTGVLLPLPLTPSSVVLNSEWAIIDDGSALHAFSGVTGTLAPVLAGTFIVTGLDDVAFANGTPTSYAYSPLTNAWTPAPTATWNSISLVRNAAILVENGGYDAYCSRTGTWSHLSTATTGTFQTLSTGATFVALDGNSMSVFDSRLGRWNTILTSAPPFTSIWRLTLLAHDGTTGFGFAMTTNNWDTVTFQSPPQQMVANDSVGFIRTGTDLHFFCSPGSLTTVSRYPEFSRMQPRGTPLRFLQTGPSGAQVTVVIAGAGAYAPAPPFGTVLIDLSTLIGVVPLGTIPATGVLDLSFQLPDDPALNNVPVYLQDIIEPISAPAYISNSMSPIIV